MGTQNSEGIYTGSGLTEEECAHNRKYLGITDAQYQELLGIMARNSGPYTPVMPVPIVRELSHTYRPPPDIQAFGKDFSKVDECSHRFHGMDNRGRKCFEFCCEPKASHPDGAGAPVLN